MSRLRMFCGHCGSTNVGQSACVSVSQNKDTQEWELGGIYSSWFCDDCGRDDSVEEKEKDHET